MIAARGYADGTSARDGSDISLDERLAFERLLGDLSAAIPEDFPPEAKVEIEYCRRIGLRSNLGIPLRVGGRVMGLIAFTAFHRTRAWPEDLIIRLNVFPVLVPRCISPSTQPRRRASLRHRRWPLPQGPP